MVVGHSMNGANVIINIPSNNQYSRRKRNVVDNYMHDPEEKQKKSHQ